MAIFLVNTEKRFPTGWGLSTIQFFRGIKFDTKMLLVILTLVPISLDSIIRYTPESLMVPILIPGNLADGRTPANQLQVGR